MEEKYIDVLNKRLHHLTQRIMSSNRDLSYDKAEASALSWALDIITKYFILIARQK